MTNKFKVYYLCKRDNLDKIFKEGIVISEFFDKKIGFTDINIPFVTTYLSPEGLEDKLKDFNYVCLEIMVNGEECYAADKDLWDALMTNTGNFEIRRMYYSSMMKLSNYRYGDYRIPEILVQSNIAPENIKMFSKKQKRFLSFTEEYNPYYGCIVEDIREEKGNTYITYIYCQAMVQEGEFEMLDEIPKDDGSIRIYYDRRNKKCIHVMKKRQWRA